MAAAGKTMDIVTVVFDHELPLLELQARSLGRFADAAAVARILVVVNDVREDACAAAVARLVPCYGPLADRVEVVHPEQLLSSAPAGWRRRAERWFVAHARGPVMRRLPRRDRLAGGWRGNPGWSMQQALKLLAANGVTAPYTLILDAKNFLVAPVGIATFVAPDGRARSRRVAAGELQRGWVAASFRALGMPPAEAGDVPPTVTPVVLERGLAREGLAALEARLGPLEAFFSLHKGRATEFMLLFAVIDRGEGRWWQRLAEGLPEATTVFAKGGDNEVAALLAGAGSSPMMGLHRRVLQRLGPETQAALGRFWVELGLFPSLRDTRPLFAERRLP